VVSTILPLVDPTRPTISHGTLVSNRRALTTTVWAPAEPGRWPLIVFGHGYQVGPQPYTALLEAWASHGYVVAAPEFPLADQSVAGDNLDEGDLVNEPADLRFVIDSLVAPGSPEAAAIDPGRVAAAGHSDGAEAALAVGLNPAPPGEPAVRAVVAMAASPLLAPTPVATPPALQVQGDADPINPMALAQQLYAQLGSPKFFLDLVGGADHLSPFEGGSPWLSTVEAVSEDFLDLYLSDQGSVAALTNEGNRPSLSTIQATLSP
jgi:acetyl esterase/lipase